MATSRDTTMRNAAGNAVGMPDGAAARRVCVGIIVGAHGVRGAVRVKSFTHDAADVAAYGPLSDEGGKRRFALTPIGAARGAVLARLEGVADRNAAEALRGTRLYAERASFPPTGEDEFYHADLIGLDAETADGARLGTVRGLGNYGAGDVIELALEDGRSVSLPFTKALVPVVDLAGRRVVVIPPPELMPAPARVASGNKPGEKSA